MSRDWDAYEVAREGTNSFNWEPPGREKPMIECKDISDEELVQRLRKAASAWFNDNELMLLEELIRRAQNK